MIHVIDMSVCSIDLRHPAPEIIQRASDALSKGELIVAPTETRYGLLARGDSDEAIGRVFDAKGRAPLQPTALFVRDENHLRELGEVTKSAEILMRRWLPGPLTLVLRSRVPWGPPRVADGFIGIRWSNSPVISELLRLVAFPITATSANRSGSGDLDTVEQIRAVLGDSVALYLDGGTLNGPASTVVKCDGDRVTVLRIGGISAESIHLELKAKGM